MQDVLSGKRRKVADFRGSNSAPAWSPDGPSVAVTLSRDGLAAVHDPRAGGRQAADQQPGDRYRTGVLPRRARPLFRQRPWRRPQIYRMPVAGGPVERITFTGAYNISPALSPDGRLLAYIARQGSAYKLMLMELPSGTPRVLTDTDDDNSPSFAPNGRLLVYASRIQGRGALMTTTLDGKIKSRLLSTGADMREPAWGPFGR